MKPTIVFITALLTIISFSVDDLSATNVIHKEDKDIHPG